MFWQLPTPKPVNSTLHQPRQPRKIQVSTISSEIKGRLQVGLADLSNPQENICRDKKNSADKIRES